MKKITFFLTLLLVTFFSFQSYSQISFIELTGGSNPFNGITIEGNIQFVPGDFDADGDIDFYSWDGVSANFTFYKNNGSGSFSATTGSGNPFDGFTRKAPAYNSATSMYVQDWDNDGDVDVFNTNYESAGDNRYFQNNNGTFTELTGGSNPFNGITIEGNIQFVPGDFDADGAIDFYSWDGVSANFTFYKNNGSGSFSATTGSGNPFDGFTRKAPAYNSATSMYVQDWDNDGDVDVFNTNYESAGDNRYFQNNNGTFTELTGGSNPFNGITIEGNIQFVPGDFDADGAIDFYSWDGVSANFTFYKNNGSGSFSATTGSGNPFDGFTRKAPAYNSATSMYVQDWDNDGDVDVFNTNYESAGDNRYFQLAGSPPSISSTSPIDEATGVNVGDNIVLNFSEPVTVLSGNVSIRNSSDNSLVESIDVTSLQLIGSGTTTITVNPSSDLDEVSGYYVLIDKASFEDIDNAIFLGIEDKVTLNFTTGSTVPPVFENSTPSSSAVAQTTFTLETDIDEAGTIYYVVVADGASAPTSAEVKAGTGSGGSGQINTGSAVVNTGGFTNDFSVTSLTAGTAYDVYVVAEDDEGTPNLQVSPTKIDVTTASLIALTVTVAANNKQYDNTTTATVGTASLSGVVGMDDVSINGVPGAFSFATPNVGTGITVTATGNYTITGADSGNYSISQPTFSADITAKALTVTVAANNKPYDNTTTATVGAASLSGIVGMDDVSINGVPSAFNFATVNVGTGITVTATGNYTITGADSGNYSVSQPTFSADITVKALTVTVAANNKQYDDTTTATVGAVSLSGVVGMDDVSINGVPSAFNFATANVGTGITVTATGNYTITGADAGNYSISQPTFSADITAKSLTVTVAANNKQYDDTTTATVDAASLSGIVGMNDVSINGAPSAFNFVTPNVGTGIIVTATGNYTITGADAGNYSISQPTFSADITAKALTVTVAANNKQYDNTTTATVGAASLSGVVGMNDVSINGTPSAFNFATPNVGTGITVTATGNYTITGADAGNYSVSQPTFSADITSILGLDDTLLKSSISLYPNPVNNTLHIKTNNIKLEEGTLYNILGKTIKNVKLDHKMIDFSGINSGVYLLKITTDKGTFVERIIKK